MTPRDHKCLRRRAVSLLLTVALSLTFSSIPQSASSVPPPQAATTEMPWHAPVPQTLEAGFWRVDGDYVLTLQIKNGLVVHEITVTPVLFLRDGTEFDLAPVKLPIAGSAEVDLNQALLNAPPSVAQHLSDFGSAAVRFSYAVGSVIDASIKILNKPKSLSFVVPFQHFPDAPTGPQFLDGLWWKHDAGVDGFVALANTTDGLVTATVQGISSHGSSEQTREISLEAHETKQIRLSEVLENLHPGGERQGGVRVSYSGKPGDLYVIGGLINEEEGYSANILFWAHGGENDHNTMNVESTGVASEPPELTYASVGVMVGEPDPLMMFPPKTVFTPYAVMRNTAERPIEVRLGVNFMANGKPNNVVLPAQTIGPGEARQLPVRDLLEDSGLRKFSGMINLTLRFKASPSELLVSVGSVDNTGTYVLAVPPNTVHETLSQELPFWSVADGNDSMISLWNPADQAQNLSATLYYADGSGRYTLPVHLDPGASTMIDVKRLIEAHQPDAEGKFFSTTEQQGGVVIANAKGVNQPMTVSVSGGTLNVQTATCVTIVYKNCLGYVLVDMSPPTFVTAVNGSKQLAVMGTYHDGTIYNLSSGTAWSSTNTGVATVQTMGAASPGMVAGVAPGSVTIQGSIRLSADGKLPYPSNQPAPSCFFQAMPTGSGNVFSISSVMPNPLVIGTSGLMTITGSGFSGKGTPSIQFDGAGISTVNASVMSDTEIQAGYAVSCQATSQDVSVSFSGADGAEQSNMLPIAVALPVAPAPIIQFGGNNVSGTTNVVVGQQIALTASVSLPACMTFSSQSWSIPPGTAVGGYVNAAGTGIPDTNGGQVKALPPKDTTDPLPLGYTFYWVYPGSSFNMAYQYTMSGGFGSVNSPVATATFSVSGGGGVMGSAAYSHLNIENLPSCNTTTPLFPTMVYGNTTGTICKVNLGSTFGVTFTAPSTSSSGAYSYIQIINGDSSTQPGAPSCTFSQGIDGNYPYAGLIPNSSPLQAVDAPGIQLLASSASSVQRTFSATMFLMWTPNLPNSIPVPIGYQTWGFSGTASCSTVCGTWTNWTATANGTPGLVGNFVQSNGSQTSDGHTTLQFGYPTWNNAATQSCH